MRWQPFAVVAALAAPPLLLAVLVWPSGASAVDAGGDDDEVAAELHPGDSEQGTVSGSASADYLIVGNGENPVRIDVDGAVGLDATLTLVDPESGESLDYNDDTNELDPQLVIDLDDGETVRAEVRSLGGNAGSFEISVRTDDDGADDAGDGGPVETAPPRPNRPGPTVVLPAGPATTIPAG